MILIQGILLGIKVRPGGKSKSGEAYGESTYFGIQSPKVGGFPGEFETYQVQLGQDYDNKSFKEQIAALTGKRVNAHVRVRAYISQGKAVPAYDTLGVLTEVKNEAMGNPALNRVA